MRGLSFVAVVVLAAVAILYLLRHHPAAAQAPQDAAGVAVRMGPYGVQITDNRPEPGAGGCCHG